MLNGMEWHKHNTQRVEEINKATLRIPINILCGFFLKNEKKKKKKKRAKKLHSAK
jgi:hypothetical protein